MNDLIADFPHLGLRKLHGVQFAETAQMTIYECHHNVARHELWYTSAEFISMRRAVFEDVLEVRAARTASNEAAAADGDNDDDNDASTGESSRCLIGIEHLLTPASVNEVRACRARCTHAVLAEQARQAPSARFRLETIAFASLAQTRQAAMRARKLGRFHQDSL